MADWVDRALGCTNWSVTFGADLSCIGGDGTYAGNLPGAMLRGGDWTIGDDSGVFALYNFDPAGSFPFFGFRCAR